MKILIIEDDKGLAEMYKRQFELAGNDVVLAHDGASGVVAIKTERPHVVLLDLVMPIMDGYEVINELKKEGVLDKTHLYVLTNLSQESEIKKGMEMGVKAYLIKSSFTPSELLKRIEDLVDEPYKKTEEK